MAKDTSGKLMSDADTPPPERPELFDDQSRIKWLESRCKKLEEQVAALVKWVNERPLGPVTLPFPDGPVPLTPWVPTLHNPCLCHVCGIDLSKATHYVCTNDQCPSRVWCSSKVTVNPPAEVAFSPISVIASATAETPPELKGTVTGYRPPIANG